MNLPIKIGVAGIIGNDILPQTSLYYKNAGLKWGKNSLNYLIVELIKNELWDKIYVLHPNIGETEEQVKLNVKNPVDTDEAQRKEFTNSPFIIANEVRYDKTKTQYANTNIIPSTSLLLNNLSVTYKFNLEVEEANGTAYGVVDSSVSNGILLYNPKTTAGGAFAVRLNDSGAFSELSGGTSKGISTHVRSTSLIVASYKDGVLVKLGSRASTNLSTKPIFEGCYSNNGTPANYYSNNYGFQAWGESLTSDEVGILKTIVDEFYVKLKTETVYDVYIQLGDSQAQGEIAIADFGSPYLNAQTGAIYDTNVNKIVPIGVSTTIGYGGDTITFKRAIEQELSRQYYIDKGRKCIIFKVAKGSTYLAAKPTGTYSFSPDGLEDAYDINYRFKTAWPLFTAYLDTLGVSYNIKSVLCFLGDNDSRNETDANNFQANFNAFIDNTRLFLNDLTVPFVFPEIYSDAGGNEPYWEIVRGALQYTVANKSNCYSFDAANYGRVDTIHYDKQALIDMAVIIYNITKNI